MLVSTAAYASSKSLPVSAAVYDLDKDSHYVIGEASPSASAAIGTFYIEGDVRISNEVNHFPAYEVNSGSAAFTYIIAQEVFSRAEEEWHLVEDKSKKVNGLNLDSDMLSGALILQTSLDGVTWTEDILMLDIFAEDADTNGFYTTKDIQLQNGCYYKVIVAYKMELRLEDSVILSVTTKNYTYKQVAEVYEFYAFCETDELSPDAEPRKMLGSKINTGKDNGYSGSEPIDKDDPHFGWDIGYFFINGYTRETAAADQTPVFLKNVGDKVTLWFHLTEDITKLHGDENLSVSEDTNGYDRAFEIEQTNFKRGTLIIQYTNSQGEAQDPIIYTDYLAANARTGANTKVRLFEEGDYVVSLDYEIKSTGGIIDKLAKYTNYKIMFEFSIRNGNCMVYPFDILTGAELADNAITENGFKLDMAKSKYLTIDVQRSVLVFGTDGYLTEDVRFNRPAKDGDVYTSEGIYIFNVTNPYTDQHTVKSIYVGSNTYLRALSATGMSIAELNAEINKGAIVSEDRTVEDVSTSAENLSEAFPEETAPENTPLVTEEPDSGADKEPRETNAAPIIIGAVAVILLLLALGAAAIIRKKAKAKEARINDEGGNK